MKTITLSDEQVSVARELSTQIKESKTYTKTWAADNIFLGILGETAYAEMKGFTVNKKVWDSHTDGGIDFEDGTDIKTISYTGPKPELKLGKIPQFTRKKKLVLAICDYKNYPNRVDLVGEISFDNFKAKSQLRTYGDKSWYAVGVSDLDSIYE